MIESCYMINTVGSGLLKKKHKSRIVELSAMKDHKVLIFQALPFVRAKESGNAKWFIEGGNVLLKPLWTFSFSVLHLTCISDVV